MTQTDGERRAYAKGYNRANSNCWSRTRRIIEIAKSYRARLKDFDTARVCETCARWTRGCDACHWGYCSADFEFGIDERMWIDSDGPTSGVKIVTQARFGCVSWIASKSPPPSIDAGRG
jgi:hypothetical protein